MLPPRVVLLGRPNSGKSSLFNCLTEGNAHVGNFPGVTVEILEADVALPNGSSVTVVDLPGIYAVDAAIDPATDEGIAVAFLERVQREALPFVVLQVLDSTRLALGLRLTRELLQAGYGPIIVATQADALDADGYALDVAGLEATVALPVVHVSARSEHAPTTILKAVEQELARPSPRPPPAVSWDPDELATHVISQRPVVDDHVARHRTLTARLDTLLLHPVLGPVLFLGLMALTFAAVFLIADPVTRGLNGVFGVVALGITQVVGDGWLQSFLVDGILGGVGTLVTFMPQIVILTVAMEVLEASGYLARGAFLMDRLLRLMGLSGRSFVPLLMSHACAIPAITATRILRDPRERLTTLLVLPLMACSARLPTYGLLLAAFFSAYGPWTQALLFIGLYFSGIVSGLIASLVLRRTATQGRSLPFVLEMPPYRAPEPMLILRKASQAAGRFARDIGTTILATSAILWILLTVPVPRSIGPFHIAHRAHTDSPIENSIGAEIGRILEPITAPLGFDWRINVGLIGAFGQREVMVGTLGVIFGLENAEEHPAPLADRIREARRPDGRPLYPLRTGMALLAFFVLACQCMSTLAALRRETKGWRWPFFVFVYTYAAAYAAAFIIAQGGVVLARLHH